MSRSFKTRGLGKGLSALLSDNLGYISGVTDKNTICNLSIDQLIVNPNQPRKCFDDNSLKELSESICIHGIIQPIIVNRIADQEKYIIIAGERRWRAAKIANLFEVPVIIKEIDEKQIFQISLIENIQRQELNIIEEAEGYKKLIEEFGFTQEELSKTLGKSRSHVTNILRLNILPKDVKEKLIQGKITMGHARTLIGSNYTQEIVEVIIDKNLSVRETERYIKKLNSEKKQEQSTVIVEELNNNFEIDDLNLLIQSLSSKFGTRITIDNSQHGGKITIFFSNLEELDNILSKIR